MGHLYNVAQKTTTHFKKTLMGHHRAEIGQNPGRLTSSEKRYWKTSEYIIILTKN